MDIRPPERAAIDPSRAKPRRGTWVRIAGWGAAAAFATGTLAIVAQSPQGEARIKVATAGLDAPADAAAVAAIGRPPSVTATRLLEASIADLSSDRDRLAARVAALESGLQDLTGSIRTQPIAASPGAAPPLPVPAMERAIAVPMVVAVAPPLINPLATPPAGVASILPEPPPKPAAPEAAPPRPAAVEMSPPEASAEPVPLPPERMAELTPAEPAERAKPEPPKPAAAHARAEFGVELATEPTVDNLRQRWSGVKANYGPLLVGLSPVAVRDRHPGSTAVRLVAGPLPSLAAARQLCARFAAQSGDCWPTRINPADVIQR